MGKGTGSLPSRPSSEGALLSSHKQSCSAPSMNGLVLPGNRNFECLISEIMELLNLYIESCNSDGVDAYRKREGEENETRHAMFTARHWR